MTAKATGTGTDWAEEAKNIGGQARDRAASLAADGKTKASDALTGLGKIIADNAGALDDKLGSRYGDYARTAAKPVGPRSPAGLGSTGPATNGRLP